MHRSVQLLLLSLLVSFVFVHTAKGGARVPVPSWIKLVGIGDKVVRNGLPATMYAFSTTRSPEEVFQYYRDIWQNRGGTVKAVREVYIAPWRILSHVENRLLYTLQVRDDEQPGTIGYLAVSEPDNVHDVSREDTPAPRGSRVIDRVQFKDNGNESRIVQLENRYTSEDNIAFYHDYYTSRGWTGRSDSTDDAIQVLNYTRGRDDVRIVINGDEGGSRIVINCLSETEDK